MAEGQSLGWSDKRKARYLGLNHFDRCSRHDPDKKSKKKSRKIAPSSHDRLILINIWLLFGEFALPPSGLSSAFTSPHCIPDQPWGLSLSVVRACPAQYGVRNFQFAFLGYYVFEWKVFS